MVYLMAQKALSVMFMKSRMYRFSSASYPPEGYKKGTSESASVDKKVMIDTDGGMCGSVGGRVSFGFEFFPSFMVVVADESVACNDVFA